MKTIMVIHNVKHPIVSPNWKQLFQLFKNQVAEIIIFIFQTLSGKKLDRTSISKAECALLGWAAD